MEETGIVVYHDDFGTLSSGNTLEAERKAAGYFANAATNLAEALLALVSIQDDELWKHHYYLTQEGEAGPQVFKNFWDQYVPWFVTTYGPSIGMGYSADWIRARIRMFRSLAEEGYTMQQVLAVPLDMQYLLEKVVDMKEFALKGQAGSEAAAKELINAVMHGEVDKSSLLALTNGVSLAFYFDGKTITGVMSDGDGLVDVEIAVIADNVPGPVKARFLSKLQAKSR